jgi:bacillithiol biosynthesis cysteine-adding enzyme BshC
VETQVNSREINFFYLLDNFRERIVYEDGKYQVLNSEIAFTEADLLTEIENHPERFSPNVVMRPLYQEIILPNIAYVGGGAEIVYWLQLKQNFDFYSIKFPILIPRNSALIVDETVDKKLTRFDLNFLDLFKNTADMQKEWILKHSEHTLDLKKERQEFEHIFNELKTRATKIDFTLGPSTEAVKIRLEKALISLEKKLVKAEKKNHEEAISAISSMREKLFPKGGLQERSESFALFYVKSGDCFIESLFNHFKPLNFKFSILQEGCDNNI